MFGSWIFFWEIEWNTVPVYIHRKDDNLDELLQFIPGFKHLTNSGVIFEVTFQKI